MKEETENFLKFFIYIYNNHMNKKEIKHYENLIITLIKTSKGIERTRSGKTRFYEFDLPIEK